MYEQENRREEEHLAVAAGTDPHTADAGLVEHQQEQAGLKIEHGQSGQNGPNAGLDCEQGQNGPGDNRHLQDLPSSGGVGGGRSGGGGGGPDCKACKRNFWTSVLNAVIKISTYCCPLNTKQPSKPVNNQRI